MALQKKERIKFASIEGGKRWILVVPGTTENAIPYARTLADLPGTAEQGAKGQAVLEAYLPGMGFTRFVFLLKKIGSHVITGYKAGVASLRAGK